jgi:hypothetical protein
VLISCFALLLLSSRSVLQRAYLEFWIFIFHIVFLLVLHLGYSLSLSLYFEQTVEINLILYC